MNELLRVEHLIIRHGERVLVDDVSFTLLPGRPFTLLGRSGARGRVNLSPCRRSWGRCRPRSRWRVPFGWESDAYRHCRRQRGGHCGDELWPCCRKSHGVLSTRPVTPDCRSVTCFTGYVAGVAVRREREQISCLNALHSLPTSTNTQGNSREACASVSPWRWRKQPVHSYCWLMSLLRDLMSR